MGGDRAFAVFERPCRARQRLFGLWSASHDRMSSLDWVDPTQRIGCHWPLDFEALFVSPRITCRHSFYCECEAAVSSRCS